MASGDLTAEAIRSLLDYDSATGIFRWKVYRGGKAVAGSVAGTLDKEGYRDIRVCSRHHKAHRLAWVHVYGIWPTHGLDHINGVKDDNRIDNLRDVAPSANSQNMRRAHSGNLSGHLGVCLSGRPALPWVARIRAKGKDVFLGRFKTVEEAHQAYMTAKRALHEGNTL